MAKLVISAQMTIDGVLDSTEKWFLGTGEHEEAGHDQLFAADALLLGRKTYVGLAAVWPTITDQRGFADRVNSMPKHVVSTTLTGPLGWNAQLVEGTLADRVRELKQGYAGNLLSYGCGGLAHELTRLGLVDEIWLFVHPVVFGPGERPFHGRESVKLRLASTTMFRSGVALLKYVPEPR